MQIFINIIQDTFVLDVQPSDTIDDVKVKIEAKKGIPIDCQRLVFDRKVLKNDRSLSNYNIQHGFTIHFVLYMYGGGKDFDKKSCTTCITRLDQAHIDNILENEEIQYGKEIEALQKKYRASFNTWLVLLDEGFNLAMFGLGSKKPILQEFHRKTLTGRDSMIINGFFPSLTIKQILNSMTEEVLKHIGTFASLSEQVEFIQTHLKEPLYLIVHNIDGPMLRNDKSQSVLAQLAAHPCIRIACSIDHINAPLIWDHAKLSQFNFTWFNITTFLPYNEETRNENSFLAKQSGALELNSLKHVFASLAPNAKRIYTIVIEHQLECLGEDGYQGISFQDLYRRSRKAFLVNSDLTLRAQLTEFKDHKLVQVKKDADGIEYLLIPLKNAILEEFLELQQ